MEDMVTTESAVAAVAAVAAETAEITAPRDEPERVRSGRARAVMLVATGMLIAVAFVLGAVGSQARSKSSDERARARVATERRRALDHRGLVADRDLAETERAMSAVPQKFDALGTAMSANEVAEDHFTDVVNHGADLYNGGDLDGATALYQGEATAALADVAQRTAEVQQAWKDVQAALGALEEVQ
jgi:hypothetical protein